MFPGLPPAGKASARIQAAFQALRNDPEFTARVQRPVDWAAQEEVINSAARKTKVTAVSDSAKENEELDLVCYALHLFQTAVDPVI
jgi:uncharacterized membrane protein YcjF (UPF0283 family)